MECFRSFGSRHSHTVSKYNTETLIFYTLYFRLSVCLRYVSDQAYNGYKSYCQHKLLCWDMNGSAVARSHPPTQLEWQAAKAKVNMAAECHFPDGKTSFNITLPPPPDRLLQVKHRANGNES